MSNTGINRAALTSRLAALVEHGILERDPPAAKRAQYRLTQAGQELAPMMTEMRAWGEKWLFNSQVSEERSNPNW